ncbi:MAG: polysaccharide biosynthesis/export family protein [Bacteroidales bacterium]
MKKVWIFLLIAVLLSSCKVLNPERMLRTPPDYEYTKPEDVQVIEEYRLAPNDQLYFRLYTNDGEKLIDPVNPLMQQHFRGDHNYLIEFDGFVKIPVLGRVKLSGMTLREAEKYLEESFTEYYNNPFVQLKVTNNRVIVFPGGRGGTSQVVYLENTNTNLFEALAMAGGIADGRANRVKVIRGDLNNPQVFLIDLSTIEGVKDAEMILQANDIIYVEPRERVPQRIMENIGPYLSLFSAALIIYSIFK